MFRDCLEMLIGCEWEYLTLSAKHLALMIDPK